MAPQSRYPHGYASVAAFIAKDKDKTTTIFRRFDRLAARNLLHLQSEVQELEALQDELDNENLTGHIQDEASASTSWEVLKHRSKTESAETKRLEVAKQIEQALKKYQKALLLHGRILAQDPPAKDTLRAYKRWFTHEEHWARGKTRLRGHSSHILDDDDDLIALRVPARRDRFTLFIQTYFPWQIIAAAENDIEFISENTIARFVAIFSTILAATLLVGAVVALNFCHSQDLRLGLISLFTSMFAASIALLTNARQTELFAATAAYMAVLVVFISGNTPAPTS